MANFFNKNLKILILAFVFIILIPGIFIFTSLFLFPSHRLPDNFVLYISSFLLLVYIFVVGGIFLTREITGMHRMRKTLINVSKGKYSLDEVAHKETEVVEKALKEIIDRLQADSEKLKNQAATIEKSNRLLGEKVKEKTEELIMTERFVAMGELSAEIAHEMNNIIMPIEGYAKMIQEETGNKQIREKAEIISENASRGSSIIKKLLAFSHPEKKELSPLDINNMIKKAVDLLSYRLKRKHININLKLSPTPKILGDPEQLQQVFINFILNAEQAMPDGGKIKIETNITPLENIDRKYVETTISDTGPGVGKDIIKNIFKPFFTTKGERGTGLGLSISFNIVNYHGGKILVKSSKKGASFIVRLPQMIENI
jgi:two-component system NtrC family sensor kinase